MHLSLTTILSLALGGTVAGRADPSTVPVNFGMVLFPAWEALDVIGPLEAINHLAGDYKIKLSLLSYDLNPVSTKSLRVNPLGSDSQQRLVPTHTFANAPQDLDVLMVPGGSGTRYFNRTDGHEVPVIAAMDFIKETYPKLKYLITVCTGSALVAKTGLLDGKRATSNKMAWAWATQQGPNVEWVPKARWIVDGNIWSSSGVSAGIDVTYAFISEVYGEDVAADIAWGAEYVRNTDPDNDPFAVVINETSTEI